MTRLVRTAIASLLVSASLIAQTNTSAPRYKDPRLPLEERVNDLISRMTLDEKISQMMNAAPAIPRLDIPAYDWWNEALHGVARAGRATVFPQAIGLAATWDTDLMFRVADVISTEARAKHHEFDRQGDRARYKGLTMWSPNINIFRDPRWGRGQETYGEDPYLTARMGVQFVKGLQGNDPKYFKVISTPKHYAVHSGPEPDRHHFDASTDQRDLYDTYLPAFEALIKEAGAFSVMCAYNRYLGEPCCSHSLLLEKLLRAEWKFPGYVVSDCGAIDDIYRGHKVAPDAAAASAMAVKAGTDLECGTSYRALSDAVKKGLIKESELDVSLRRLFTARFKLGMFDPPDMVPYARIPIEQNDTMEHRRLSLEAARESIVLLKNEGGVLPLKRSKRKIAVIGPTADDLTVLLGNYNGTPSSYATPLSGIRAQSGLAKVVYEQGCNLTDEGPIPELVPASSLIFDGKPGLKAEYFGNRGLEGKPLLTRTDQVVDSNWVATPVPGLDQNAFSVRWSGKLTPKVSGTYVLSVTGDDGYRLWIDGALLIDNWTTHRSQTRNKSIELSGGRAYDLKLEYFQSGGDCAINLKWGVPGEDPATKAVRVAADSDVVIFVGGISPQIEGEEMNVQIDGFFGGDRTNIDLPKAQRKILEALAATGKPVVLVLTSGSALGVNWANEHVGAIVQLWYPGEEGGTALADVLFGDYNPAGRLPVTFYKSIDQLPPFDDYRMAGRTYRYFTGEPLFPFGFGLSYTSFLYSALTAPAQVKAGDNLSVSVKVRNSGKVAGDEVVQLYLRRLDAPAGAPIRALEGFKRVRLKAGQSQTVSFTLTPRQMSLIDREFRRVVEPGEVELAVGGSQPGSKGARSASVTTKVRITGKSFEVSPR